jgi:hypothetical protein
MEKLTVALCLLLLFFSTLAGQSRPPLKMPTVKEEASGEVCREMVVCECTYDTELKADVCVLKTELVCD